MAFRIRVADQDDLGAIQPMNADLFVQDVQRYPELNLQWPYEEAGISYFKRRLNGEGVCLLAETESQAIGYLAGTVCHNEPWRSVVRSEVENMFVVSSERGRGVGRALMHAFFEWSADNGARQVVVEAFAGNRDAIAFYRAMGYALRAQSLEVTLASPPDLAS